MASEQTSTSPVSTWRQCQLKLLSFLSASRWTRYFNKNILLPQISVLCQSKMKRSYSFISLHTFSYPPEIFMISDINISKVTDQVSSFETSGFCWTSRHDTVDLRKGRT